MKTQEFDTTGMEWDNSYPGGAWYDGNFWYNSAGEMLRDKEEYDPYSEGYTPFGDE